MKKFRNLDKTWKEIHDASTTSLVLFVDDGDIFYLSFVKNLGNVLYKVHFYNLSSGDEEEFVAQSENDYPSQPDQVISDDIQ